ncbi:hypothetical protein QBC46DRAFT_356479 [Diplogelasinospora grovesii]|uniref:DSC E3 ubiquitin ligase complex subunit A n=1 Tax=Diplogelasinospora grovesii TaxID=303347 RepID=A0AAN6S236_9PEZI|nr:hypothetical protein QBC46DRAFT_356479 [Diplogelasinospora grovesii]
MPASEDSRVFLLVLLILWMIVTPDSGSSNGFVSTPGIIAARVRRQRAAHGVLNSTKWGDFSPTSDTTPLVGDPGRYLNLTGFRQQDGLAWSDLEKFRETCRRWSTDVFYPTDFPQTDVDVDNGSERWGDWERGLKEDHAIWQNVTGTVHGEWVRRDPEVHRYAHDYNLSDIAPGLNWPGPGHEWGRNITGSHGKVVLRLEEDDDKPNDATKNGKDGEVGVVEGDGGWAREAAAVLTMQDEASGGSSWQMRVHGVHWPLQGALLLTTTSEKYAGIFGLPHLSPGPRFFETSQSLLNETIDKILRKKERSWIVNDGRNPWTSDAGDGPGEGNSPSPQCEYVIYLQVHPFSTQSLGDDVNPLLDPRAHSRWRSRMGIPAEGGEKAIVGVVEDELRNPTGAPIKEIPELRMSMVAWSPDCGFYLESKGPPSFSGYEGHRHLMGVKEEVQIYRIKMWILAMAAIVMGQIYLLKGQMRESSTPSTIGRVSFYTACMMLLADGLCFMGAVTLTLAGTHTFYPSLVLTFATFISMTVSGAFLADVWRIQEPERRNREPPTTRTRPTPAQTPMPAAQAAAAAAIQRDMPVIVPSDQDVDAEIAENTAAAAAAAATPILPPPATAPTTTTPSPTPSRGSVTTFQTITGRLVFVGIVITFLSLLATTWPTSIRSCYCNLIAFLYLSLWVPQIWRNVQRNSRRAYAWRFMIGQSVLRPLPIAYFYLLEDNILLAEPDWMSVLGLAGWLWTQLWILAFQDVLGPRYGIPKGWTAEAWDYHPVLREDNLEAGGLPIGLTSGEEPTSPTTLGRIRSDSLLGEATTAGFSGGTGGTAGDHGGGSGGGGARRREREKERERRGMHTRSIDCAICREVLEVPVISAGGGGGGGTAEGSSAAVDRGVAGVLARRAYMVTPCRHIFHTKCLEGWMRFRLQCPICREELPPL